MGDKRCKWAVKQKALMACKERRRKRIKERKRKIFKEKRNINRRKNNKESIPESRIHLRNTV
jgi:hypothetical protein